MSSSYSNPFKGKPWMYSKPSGSENYNKWVTEWTHVLLNLCENEYIHLINRNDLKQTPPLTRLDDESYNSLIEYMISTDYIKSWSNGNLRIYWKSINGWLDELMEWLETKVKPLFLDMRG